MVYISCDPIDRYLSQIVISVLIPFGEQNFTTGGIDPADLHRLAMRVIGSSTS